MSYTFVERQKIHQKAKKILGIKPKQDGTDRYIFISQCVADMIDSGETDDALEAHDICNLLWDDLEGMYDEGD